MAVILSKLFLRNIDIDTPKNGPKNAPSVTNVIARPFPCRLESERAHRPAEGCGERSELSDV
jgi:hypothetical protein